MATHRMLGKISFAEFGTVPDYPFRMGVQLGFSMGGGSSGIGDGGKHTVNIGSSCKWEQEHMRAETVTLMVDNLHKVLKDAKVNYVSQLIDKPVEVVIEDGMFREFRILTEVL